MAFISGVPPITYRSGDRRPQTRGVPGSSTACAVQARCAGSAALVVLERLGDEERRRVVAVIAFSMVLFAVTITTGSSSSSGGRRGRRDRCGREASGRAGPRRTWRRQEAPCRGAVSADRTGTPLRGQQRFERLADDLLVVDDEDGWRVGINGLRPPDRGMGERRKHQTESRPLARRASHASVPRAPARSRR